MAAGARVFLPSPFSPFLSAPVPAVPTFLSPWVFPLRQNTEMLSRRAKAPSRPAWAAPGTGPAPHAPASGQGAPGAGAGEGICRGGMGVSHPPSPPAAQAPDWHSRRDPS